MKNYLILACFIIFISSCSSEYTYQDHLSQILGIDEVQIKGKTLKESWAIGEWYICESYKLDKSSISSFIEGKKNNDLYSSDTIWHKVNWRKLPVDSLHENVLSMVINYKASKTIDKLTSQMKSIIDSNTGYYSFLYQPPMEYPPKLIFFLLDGKNDLLYVVDLKF